MASSATNACVAYPKKERDNGWKSITSALGTRYMRATPMAPNIWQSPEHVSFGKHILHESHNLGYRQGVVWYWTCGKYAVGKPLQGPANEGMPQRTRIFLDFRRLCRGEALGPKLRNLNQFRKGASPIRGITWDWNTPSTCFVNLETFFECIDQTVMSKRAVPIYTR